jgi:hypothetical protein
MKKILVSLCAVLLIAGCTMQVADRPMPRFAYKQYPATSINVANIEIQENYKMAMQSPNVEHFMPLPLPQAVADWARTRFKATGTEGTMTIIISQAAVTEKALPRTTGVKGWFTVDQTQRYDSRLLVEFRVDGTPDASGSGVVNLTRGMTMGEDASIQARDKVWTSISESLMTDLDAATQKMLQERLAFVL